MKKTGFKVVRRGSEVFISRDDITRYLADEATYAVANAGKTELHPEFVDGLVFALSQAKESFGALK